MSASVKLAIVGDVTAPSIPVIGVPCELNGASATVAALGGVTRLPKRPSASLFRPAVKNSVLVGPPFAAPLPKATLQRPSLVIGVFDRSTSVPWKTPDELKALIVPSPKL